ncbi:hypothetical protein [Pseudanabaena sp. BC1403]|uniref:hypothetical protein n=1 Tax=Pseudanabaena sp. BC1403 TaxID=2043171 RepID=UPI000CD86A29|nr:hypothetical protein [Pseudanabaena sp. BC1403]
MNIFYNVRRTGLVLALMLILTFTTACGASQTKTSNPIVTNQNSEYGQLERGNSAAGQDFGDWVIKTGKGLIKDAYVRDRNKLGVVISPKVLPTEVKALTKSLVQGFRHNFPNQDLTILIYAPDKKLILTARYDTQSQQIDYQQAS